MNDQQWEQNFAKLAHASGMNALPQEMRDQLMVAFNAHQRTRPSLVQRLLATLSFDSFTQPLPQGARKSGFTQTRQLFYICKLGDITIDLMQHDDAVTLTGQLFFQETVEPFTVDIVRESNLVAQTTTSASRIFRLKMAPQTADIAITNHDYDIVLKDVPCGWVRD